MTRRPDKLSEDDRVLWNLVARTARPLKGRIAVDVSEIAAEARPTPPQPAQPAANAAGVAKPKAQHVTHRLDEPTLDKLSKGRLPIEGRVDLHGMTQSEAHALLFSFLHRAYADGLRYVLVITGKGSSLGSDGVLKRAVPVWLATSTFRGMVSSHDAAARHHGGAGALYVRLRRRSGGDRP